jgi:hypothetical protein
MTAKSNVRYSTPSATRVGLAVLLTCLLVFPDGVALAQTCSGNSTWTASGATLTNPIETFGAAVAGTSSGNVMYVIGGYNNTMTGTQLGFQKQVLHKLVSGVATTTQGTWFHNDLWKDPKTNPLEVVGFSRDLCGVVNNGYLYTVGGVYFDSKSDPTYGTSTNQVWYAPINPTNGSLGTWKSTTPINTKNNSGLQLHGTAVVTVGANTYLYVIGGSTDPKGDNLVSQYTTSAVHYAQINSDGTLGQWDVKTLPDIPSDGAGVYKTCPVVYNGSIYVSGGEDAGGPINQVVYATPTTDGTFSNNNTWTNMESNDIVIGGTATPDAAQAVVYNNGIILMGGDEGGSVHVVSTVFQGVVGTGGGVTWNDTAIPALPQPISRNAGATSGSFIFSLAGNHAGTDVSCIFYATAP